MSYRDLDRLAEHAAQAQRDGIDWPVTWSVLRRRLRPNQNQSGAAARLFAAWLGTPPKPKPRPRRKPPGRGGSPLAGEDE